MAALNTPSRTVRLVPSTLRAEALSQLSARQRKLLREAEHHFDPGQIDAQIALQAPHAANPLQVIGPVIALTPLAQRQPAVARQRERWNVGSGIDDCGSGNVKSPVAPPRFELKETRHALRQTQADASEEERIRQPR